MTMAEMRALARPSAEQRAAFVEHLCWAHSWYKHLSLSLGGDFVVFLAADAGGDYDEARPRLHYSWKTAAEYRRRFGLLDYAWRGDPGEPWSRDIDAPIEVTAELWSTCGFRLYPYCSSDGNAIEVIVDRWRQHDDGELDPAVAAQLDTLAAAHQAAEEAFHRDSPYEPDLRRACEALYEQLRLTQVATIERALTTLDELLRR
jgi:hypothetical protein